jgi:hypothetical protein
MLFMVIERFKAQGAAPVYRRFREQGRMMPEGLKYIDSWTEVGFNRCFQVMETYDPSLFAEWTANWDDLVDFEILPVLTSKEAAATITVPE